MPPPTPVCQNHSESWQVSVLQDTVEVVSFTRISYICKHSLIQLAVPVQKLMMGLMGKSVNVRQRGDGGGQWDSPLIGYFNTVCLCVGDLAYTLVSGLTIGYTVDCVFDTDIMHVMILPLAVLLKTLIPTNTSNTH